MPPSPAAGRLLALHQWGFALSVWIAVHAGGMRQLEVLLAVAAVNAAVWLVVTRQLMRSADGGARPGLGTLWLAAPALAVLAGFGLFNLYREGESLAPWPLEAGGLAITAVVAAWVYGATRDARPFLAGTALASTAIVVEGAWTLYQRGHLVLIVTLGGLRRNVGPDYPTFRMGYEQLPYVNVLASLLVVFTSLTLGLTATARTGLGRAAAWAAVAVSVGGVLLTGSRGGTLVLVLLLLTHAAYRLRVWRVSTAVGLTLLSAAFVAVTLRPGGILRGSGSLRARFHTYRVALRIARDHPLVGGGPTEFKRAWAEYGPWHGYAFKFDMVDGTYFWALSVGGVTLLTALLGLVGVLLWETALAARRLRDHPLRHALFAFGAAGGALLVHGALESNLRSRAIYVVACVLGGMLVALRRSPAIAGGEAAAGLAWRGSSYHGGAGQRDVIGPPG